MTTKTATRQAIVTLPLTLLVVLLATLASTVSASPHAHPSERWSGGLVRGVVFDRATSRPIAGASVHASGSTEFVHTDENGRFLLGDVAADTMAVVAAAEGYAFSWQVLVDDDLTFELQREVPAAVPLPDYPRPDLDRRPFTDGRWLNLNGTWSFDFDPKDVGERQRWFEPGHQWGKVIRVPFGWQSLAGFGEEGRASNDVYASQFADYKGYAWYKRAFRVPEDFPPKGPVMMRFGAVDWSAKVWLNGKLAGQHRGGFTPFEVNLGRLEAGSVNVVVIRAWEPNNGEWTPYPMGKQTGWYTATGGIWQTVWLEPRTTARLRTVHVTPLLDFQTGALSPSRSRAKVEVAARGAQAGTVEIVVRRPGEEAFFGPGPVTGGDVVGTAHIALQDGEGAVVIPIPDPDLWEPDAPQLYSAEIRLSTPGRERADGAVATFGMRKIERRWAPGHSPQDRNDPRRRYRYVYLNNHPIYLRAALDQAFNPWGVYTYTGLYQGESLAGGSVADPEKGSILYDLRKLKELGFNAARMHIKVNDPLYSYWADVLGTMVWQDMPNFGILGYKPTAKRLWEDVLREAIHRDYNHPSVIIWDDFNEAWGLAPDGPIVGDPRAWVVEMVALTRQLDPSRLVVDNSPCCLNKHLVTDINDFHDYLDTYKEWRRRTRQVTRDTYPGSSWNFHRGYHQAGDPLLNGEFGPWAGGEERDQDISWPFKYTIDLMRLRPKINGYVFTELQDIEWEWNGWQEYDRTPQHAGYLDHSRRLRGPAIVNADDAILINAPPVRTVTPGEQVQSPIKFSHFSRSELADATLRWMFAGTDDRGEWVDPHIRGQRSVVVRPYALSDLGVVSFRAPEEIRAGYLWVWLESGGEVVAENFTNVEAHDGPAPTVETSDGAYTLRLDPAKPVAAFWNQGSGLFAEAGASAAWGFGKGYFEYRVKVPQAARAANLTGATVTFEAGAKRPQVPRTLFPQTSSHRYPSKLQVSVNGAPLPSVTIPNDPADSRGALSYANDFHPGEYGYRVELEVQDVATLEAQLREDPTVVIRFDATPGGLALYGERLGRYGFAPALTLETGPAPAGKSVTLDTTYADRETSPSLYLTPPSSGFLPRKTGEVITTLSNDGPETLEDVEFELLAPEGWDVTATSVPEARTIAPNDWAHATWNVKPSLASPLGRYELLAQATYTVAGEVVRIQSHVGVWLRPPAPTKKAFPRLEFRDRFKANSIGEYKIFTPPWENNGARVSIGNGVLRGTDNSSFFTLFRSSGSTRRSPLAVIVDVKKFIESAREEDSVFAGLVKNEQNYVAAWYNNVRKEVGFDAVIDGTLEGFGFSSATIRTHGKFALVLMGEKVSVFTNSGNGWDHVTTADAGGFVNFNDPAVLSQYKFGFGVRGDEGMIVLDAFTARRAPVSR